MTSTEKRFQIDPAEVTAGKIAASSLTAGKCGPCNITADELAAGSIVPGLIGWLEYPPRLTEQERAIMPVSNVILQTAKPRRPASSGAPAASI